MDKVSKEIQEIRDRLSGLEKAFAAMSVAKGSRAPRAEKAASAADPKTFAAAQAKTYIYAVDDGETKGVRRQKVSGADICMMCSTANNERQNGEGLTWRSDPRDQRSPFTPGKCIRCNVCNERFATTAR